MEKIVYMKCLTVLSFYWHFNYFSIQCHMWELTATCFKWEAQPTYNCLTFSWCSGIIKLLGNSSLTDMDLYKVNAEMPSPPLYRDWFHSWNQFSWAPNSTEVLFIMRCKFCFFFQLFREVRIMKGLNHPNIGKLMYTLLYFVTRCVRRQ